MSDHDLEKDGPRNWTGVYNLNRDLTPGPRRHPYNNAPLCEATNKLGVPCGMIAVKGSAPPRCINHGGRNVGFRHRLINGNAQMSRWYKKVVGPKLSEAIKEAQLASPDEQLAVFEELALMRESASQFVGIYSKLLEDQAPAETLAVAALAMQNALKEVVEVCSKATKAHEKMRQYSAHDIENIIAQFTSFLWEVNGDEHRHLTLALLQLMKERLVLPSTGKVEPTDLGVDDTAREMDMSVPFVPGAEDGNDN